MANLIDVTGRIQSIAGKTLQDEKIQPIESLGISFGQEIEISPGVKGQTISYQGQLIPGVVRETGTNRYVAMSDSPFQTDPSFLTLGKTPGQFESSADVRARLGAPSGAELTLQQIMAGFQTGSPPVTGQPTIQQRTLIDIANSRPDVLAVARSQGGDPFTVGTGANTWLNDWWNTAGKNEFPGVSLKQPLAELSTQTKAAQDAVDKLGDAGTVKLGEGSAQEVGTPPPGSVDTAGVAAISEGIKASTPTQEALKAEIARIEAQRAAEASSLKTLIGAQPTALSSDELMRQAFKNLGLPEDFTKTQFQQLQTTAGEIQSLTLSLNAVNTREQQKLLAIEGQAVTMGTINSQSDQAKRSFLIEKASISADITAKAAYLQALQGNFQLVTQLVDKAVNYAFMDQTQKINDYRWMYSNYKDEMNNLTSRENQLFDTLLGSIERETAAQKADMRDKISLYINAGIPIPDMATLRNQSFEEAAQYVSTHGGDPLAMKGRELELQRQSDLEYQKQLKAAGLGSYAPSKTAPTSNNPLNILDIQRYQEAYPNAGVVAGDTEAQANAKVAASAGGKDYTDEELRTIARDSGSYEATISGIESDATIKNKDRAKLIAREIYGISSGPGIFEKGGLVDNVHNFLFGK